MANSNTMFFPADNGGGRSGIDRRQFSYSFHIPERRATQDRRTGNDRRVGKDRRTTMKAHVSLERRGGQERRTTFQSHERVEVLAKF